MSLNRYATRRDKNEASIVDALERCGIHVWRMNVPCDLLTFRQVRCPHCHGNQWLPLEVKEPHARPRKDQAAQREFLELTNCPVVRNAEQALKAVGIRVTL